MRSRIEVNPNIHFASRDIRPNCVRYRSVLYAGLSDGGIAFYQSRRLRVEPIGGSKRPSRAASLPLQPKIAGFRPAPAPTKRTTSGP